MNTQSLPQRARQRAAVAILVILTLAPGCTHIPPGSVQEYHRTTAVLGVTSQADISGIKVDGRKIVAESATFTLAFPGFTHTQTVKGLTLPNPPKEAEPK